MSCDYDFTIVQGAAGPAERIELRLAAPSGFDFLLYATRTLAVSVRAPSGAVASFVPWSMLSVAAALIVFRFEPLGLEFPELGNHLFIPVLTLDAIQVRYNITTGRVVPLIL